MGTSSSATAAAGAERGNSARFIGRIVIYGLLVIFAILYLMPLFVMLVTSFKTMDEIQNGNMLALPEAPTFDPWV
ncbi:sugar ABC transporter permease, partial [Rhizobium sp. L9]